MGSAMAEDRLGKTWNTQQFGQKCRYNIIPGIREGWPGARIGRTAGRGRLGETVFNREWVVLIEATDEGGDSEIDVDALTNLVGALGDLEVTSLHHPDRYAIQLNVDGPTVADAVAAALSRWSGAVEIVGLRPWDVARVEVLSTQEFARDLELADHPSAPKWPRPTDAVATASAAEKLLYGAFHDSLTGLLTREPFRERLTAALSPGEGLDGYHCLFVVDLDDFAGVNRDLGYAAGDSVLSVVAERLQQAAGPGAVIARIGGDEFGLLVPYGDADAMDRLARRARDVIGAPVRVAEGVATVSASIGMASDMTCRTADDLLSDASVAMCAAKGAGGNRDQWYLQGLAADTSRLDFDVDPAPDRLSYVLLLERAALAANEGGDLPGAARVLLQQVCTHAGWIAGRLTDVQEEGGHDAALDVWHTTVPERLEAVREALAARRPGEAGNLQAEVLAHGKPAWLTDIAVRSAAWAREAAAVGIRAAYAFPVRVGPEVVGVLEFFSTRAVRPDGSLLEVMTSAGVQLGRVVERRRARAAIARSEANYRTLADGVPVLMWMTGTDGRVNFLNRRWLQFTGRSLDEELGDGWMEGVHPDDVPVVRGFHDALQRRAPFEITYRLRRADGEYRWVIDRGTPLGEGDDFHGYVGGAVDVSERYRAEQDLRRSDARFRSLLDNSGALIMVLDASGMVVEEHTGTVSLGHPEGHSRGRLALEYIHPDDRDRLGKAFIEVLSAPGTSAPCECRVRAADGSWQVMQLVANNQLANGDVEGILITALDVTERAEVEMALRESETQLRDAQSLARLGTWRHDLVTGEGSWSDELYRIMGGGPRGGIGGLGPDLEAVHPDDRALLRVTIQALLADGLARVEEFRIVRPDGEVCWIQGRASTVRDGDGGVRAVFGTMQDVSEQRRALDVLAATEERWRAVLGAANGIAVLARPDGTVEVRLAPAGSALGYRPEPDTTYDLFAFIHPDDREDLRARFDRVRARPGATEAFDCRARAEDGAWRRFEGTIANLLDHPLVRGMLLTGRELAPMP